MLQILNGLKTLLNFKWLKIGSIYKFLKVIIVVKLSTYIIIPAWYLFPLPVQDKVMAGCPSFFCVPACSSTQIGGPDPDAGYAVAYVMESIGIPADGEQVYADLSSKIPFSGYVLPNGLYKYLREHGLQPGVHRGDLESLKARLSEGKPIIVLIGRHVKWQHYMVLVGYNSEKEELYFYDSQQTRDTNNSDPGNRTLGEDRFLTLWETQLPLFNNVYITVNDVETNKQ